MGLDVKMFRDKDGGDSEKIKASQVKRFQKPETVDAVIELDEVWKKSKYQADCLRKDKGALQKQVGQLFKQKDQDNKDKIAELNSQKEEIDKAIEQQNKEVDQNEINLNKAMNLIGNLVHDTVPVFQDEKDNVVTRKWGTPRELKVDGTKGKAHHHQILWMIDGFDPKKGRLIAGQRGFFLKGPAVRLSMALQNYGMQFLYNKGYIPVQPPYFMKQSLMMQTCQLSDVSDQLYQVELGNSEQIEEKKDEKVGKNQLKQQEQSQENAYLIATSEQPLSCLHKDDWMDKKELPIKYAGLSTCFRKEAGSHGKQTWGIYRVHQFEKVEQFVYTDPSESWKMHEEMITTAQEFMESLEIPYRVINIVSGALNDAAAKKYDLEAWFPGYDDYYELNSVSNCTDYQSRNLEVRFGKTKKENEKVKDYVHMLNGTLVAVQRTLTCILENYQTEEGVDVPKVLQPYMGGQTFIKYTKDLPKKGDIE